MGKTFTLVIGRNKITKPDQEFKVRGADDFNDNIIRMYSQEEKTMLESEIIKEIKNEGDFRTKNPDGTYTQCEVGEREGKKYLTSVPNGSKDDNIISLPGY